jgi:hypothetical protein
MPGLFLQFRDNTQHKPGEGDVHWAAAMEVALLHLAAAMPSYASAAFGAARQEPGHFAPFPGQRISWWDFALRDEPEAPGWPDIVAGARLPLIYDQEGQWRGPRRYEGLLRPLRSRRRSCCSVRGRPRRDPGLFRYVQRVRDAGFWMATWPASRPLKKSREAQSCGFGVPLASRTAGESTDSSRIRDVDGASKTLL